MNKEQLIFPVVYWSGEPCKHEISKIASNADYVITGAKTGELCYWTLTESNKVLPQALMIRDGSSICTALTICHLTENINIIVNASDDGYLTTWSGNGGRCLYSKLVLPFAATNLYHYSLNNGHFLICLGNHSDVYIITLATLSVFRIIKHVSSIISSAIYYDNQIPILYTITENNALYCWNFSTARSNQYQLIVLQQNIASSSLISEETIQNISYKKCFIGSKLVDWLLLNDYSDTRDGAIELGQLLLSSNLIKHVRNYEIFLDGHYYYQIITYKAPDINIINKKISNKSKHNQSFMQYDQIDLELKKNEQICFISKHHSIEYWYHALYIKRFHDQKTCNVMNYITKNGLYMIILFPNQWYIIQLSNFSIIYHSKLSIIDNLSNVIHINDQQDLKPLQDKQQQQQFKKKKKNLFKKNY